MKYAEIKNGKVSNVVLADPEVAAERGWIECPEEVGIDWDYNGTTFADNRTFLDSATPSTPTREELLQQLENLTQQIQSLT